MAVETRIQWVRAREVFDSRGLPTVEVDVALEGGAFGRASVPAGTSAGRYEAVELRDGDVLRFRGLGVLTAVAHVSNVLGPGVAGQDAADQARLDERLIGLDGTPDKRRMGANAILGVSLAACRAAAAASGLQLYAHIARLAGVTSPVLPVPMVNMVSGGRHGGGQVDIQDVLVIPRDASSFRDALAVAATLRLELGDRLQRAGERLLVALEGGWAPRFASNRDAIAWVADAVADTGIIADLAVDVAASEFADPVSDTYTLSSEGIALTRTTMVDLALRWLADFPIVSLEDPLGEDDWTGWEDLTRRVGSRVQLIGDDLFATSSERLERGIARKAGNAILVKPNQVGTLSEALQVIRLAKSAGWRTIISARSGETEDDFIADLAVGTAAGQIKVGSLSRSSRNAKWNQLLRIEETLGADAYVGSI